MLRMKIIFYLGLIGISSICLGSISPHLKHDVGKKTIQSSIKNIDFIYLINLDQRPEKLTKCLDQLKPYHVTPHRFSAVCGWDLTTEIKTALGVVFSSNMIKDRWVYRVFPEKKGAIDIDFLTDELKGKTVYSFGMTPGALGCYLSHLSILQDAYNAGYETIWIMEDDIFVEKDPHLLGSYIEKLDNVVGKDGWDILYTDMDTADAPLYPRGNNFISDLKVDLSYFWRPDVDLSTRSFKKRFIVNDDFIKIGFRMRTHSMIVRRSGMKKILDYVNAHHIFHAYDYEVALPPGINLFNIRSNVVTFQETISDTRSGEIGQEKLWHNCKKEILEELPKIVGWYNITRSTKLLDFLYEKKPETCVEIGAFGGSATYQIAKTLSFLKKGIVYSIDAWSNEIAIEGVEDEEQRKFWSNLNIQQVKDSCYNLITSKQLDPFCKLIHKRSNDAVTSFSNESIDFLYLDGNPSSQGCLNDITCYFPKVKNGGYIALLLDHRMEKNSAVAFLMNHCTWLREESFAPYFLVFQK